MKIAGNNRLVCWSLFLQPYQFKINYKKGATLTTAYAICRMENVPLPGKEWDAEEAMMCALAGSPGRVHIEFGPPSPEVAAVSAAPINCSTKQELTDDWLEGHKVNNSVSAAELGKFASVLLKCPDFAPMMRFLNTSALPESDDDVRKVVLSSTNYTILDGALYHFHTPQAKSIVRANAIVKQLCVPTALRPEVASALHEDNCHTGFDRLYALTSTKFYWPGMYAFLRQHVLIRLECQQSKRPIRPGKTP